MNASSNFATASAEHKGPPPGMLAIVFTVLFNAGLYFVISFSPNQPHFPGPWESADTIAAYFRNHPQAVLMCSFLQFGSAIPLGLFTAAIVSRLRFLGVRAAGPFLALFGGLLTAFDLALSALVLWVMAYPGISQDAAVLRALYYLVYAVGGVGYSVPLGILMAGVSVAPVPSLAWSGPGTLTSTGRCPTTASSPAPITHVRSNRVARIAERVGARCT